MQEVWACVSKIITERFELSFEFVFFNICFCPTPQVWTTQPDFSRVCHMLFPFNDKRQLMLTWQNCSCIPNHQQRKATQQIINNWKHPQQNIMVDTHKKMRTQILSWLKRFYRHSSYLPSSSPAQIVLPIPTGLRRSSASPSSDGAGSGTYSRHRNGAPTWKVFTVRGVGRFREKMSTWPWLGSLPLATCVSNERRGGEGRSEKMRAKRKWDERRGGEANR